MLSRTADRPCPLQQYTDALRVDTPKRILVRVQQAVNLKLGVASHNGRIYFSTYLQYPQIIRIHIALMRPSRFTHAFHN